MADNCKAAVLASLIGDALALGVHWDYDPDHIERVHGRVNTFLDPSPGSYHNGKQAGDFTHYGDQVVILLEALAKSTGFELNKFADDWHKMFEDYNGYIDQATRKTIINLQQGTSPNDCGSGSADLSGAARIAPLLCILGDEPNRLLKAVRAQTAMTHNNPTVLAAAEFFAHTLLFVLDGMGPVDALQKAAALDYRQVPIAEMVERGFETKELPTLTAINKFGASCHVDQALPGVIHLIAKYPEDLPTCLVECVMAGGDSAARAMVVGMVLGASLGMEAIPGIWLNGLNQKERIIKSLEKITK